MVAVCQHRKMLHNHTQKHFETGLASTYMYSLIPETCFWKSSLSGVGEVHKVIEDNRYDNQAGPVSGAIARA